MRQSAEVLSDMATHISCRLTMYGVDKGQSESIAVDIMAYLSDVYGGLNLYFPKGTKDQNDEKYDLVFADFNDGIPIAEIAKNTAIPCNGFTTLSPRNAVNTETA